MTCRFVAFKATRRFIFKKVNIIIEQKEERGDFQQKDILGLEILKYGGFII